MEEQIAGCLDNWLLLNCGRTDCWYLGKIHCVKTKDSPKLRPKRSSNGKFRHLPNLSLSVSKNIQNLAEIRHLRQDNTLWIIILRDGWQWPLLHTFQNRLADCGSEYLPWRLTKPKILKTEILLFQNDCDFLLSTTVLSESNLEFLSSRNSSERQK